MVQAVVRKITPDVLKVDRGCLSVNDRHGVIRAAYNAVLKADITASLSLGVHLDNDRCRKHISDRIHQVGELDDSPYCLACLLLEWALGWRDLKTSLAQPVITLKASPLSLGLAIRELSDRSCTSLEGKQYLTASVSPEWTVDCRFIIKDIYHRASRRIRSTRNGRRKQKRPT